MQDMFTWTKIQHSGVKLYLFIQITFKKILLKDYQ